MLLSENTQAVTHQTTSVFVTMTTRTSSQAGLPLPIAIRPALSLDNDESDQPLPPGPSVPVTDTMLLSTLRENVDAFLHVSEYSDKRDKPILKRILHELELDSTAIHTLGFNEVASLLQWVNDDSNQHITVCSSIKRCIVEFIKKQRYIPRHSDSRLINQLKTWLDDGLVWIRKITAVDPLETLKQQRLAQIRSKRELWNFLRFHASHQNAALTINVFETRPSVLVDDDNEEDENEVPYPRFPCEFSYIWERLTGAERNLVQQMYDEFDRSNNNNNNQSDVVVHSIDALQETTHGMAASNIASDPRLPLELWQEISKFNSGMLLPQAQPKLEIREIARTLRRLSSNLAADINTLACQVQAGQVVGGASAVKTQLCMIAKQIGQTCMQSIPTEMKDNR